MAVDDVPEGSRFFAHRAFTEQNWRIAATAPVSCSNAGRRPAGRVLTATGAVDLGGPHFVSGLRAFNRYPYHHGHVTQPKMSSPCLLSVPRSGDAPSAGRSARKNAGWLPAAPMLHGCAHRVEGLPAAVLAE